MEQVPLNLLNNDSHRSPTPAVLQQVEFDHVEDGSRNPLPESVQECEEENTSADEQEYRKDEDDRSTQEIAESIPLANSTLPNISDTKGELPPKNDDSRKSSLERKRTRSATTSTTISIKDSDVNNSQEMKAPQAPSKKPKPSPTSDEVSNDLLGAKNFIQENQNRLPLNSSQMTEFLTACYGKSKVSPIAQEYTDDIPALLGMLTEVGDYVGSNLRHRIQRIRIRLDDKNTDEDMTGKVILRPCIMTLMLINNVFGEWKSSSWPVIDH
ncbi:hypothetical protein QAD02_021172 [Eretmocerus hayati]|uniref:Uncharacterized protein n=1 Tax=Eretmocerus hayati TaxID=131215 RepID=A0ACC2PPZ8_9HYME|nr:hypothetical protein QAD02_021172 [Eretmocerus hayati]